MILRARGGDVEVRAFAGADMPERSMVGAYGGVVVNAGSAAGVPAFDRAITIASQAVASLRMCVWSGEGVGRRRVRNAWQARLFDSGPPCPDQSWFDLWELVEASLTARRNAYIWRTVVDGRVVALWGLHPDQVVVDFRGGRVMYRVTVGDGWTDPVGAGTLSTVEVDAGTVMHIKGPGGAGRPVAPSPIDVFRRTLGAALAQDVWQEGLYTRGTGSGVILSFPFEMTESQARLAKEMWDASGAGVTNSHQTRVVSGGATVNSVGLTAEDTQFVEAVGLSATQVARITGVPATLLEVPPSGVSVTEESVMTRWVRYGLVPRLERLEAAFASDASMFGAGARFYPEFDRGPHLIRADVATEAERLHKLVQVGVLLPDEGRAEFGLEPLPDGVGRIPQITPVGGAPNAPASAPHVSPVEE